MRFNICFTNSVNARQLSNIISIVLISLRKDFRTLLKFTNSKHGQPSCPRSPVPTSAAMSECDSKVEVILGPIKHV